MPPAASRRLVAVLAALLCAGGLLGQGAGCKTIIREVDQNSEVLNAWWNSQSTKPKDVSDQTWELVRFWELDVRYLENPDKTLAYASGMFAETPSMEWAFALAELSSLAARRAEQQNPPAATEHYLKSTAYAYYFLFAGVEEHNAFDRRNSAAVTYYNDGLAKMLHLARSQGALDPDGRMQLKVAGRTLSCGARHHGFMWKSHAFHELLFAEEFTPQDHIEHQTVFGLGVPMVGVHHHTDPEQIDKRQRFLGHNHPIAVTVLFRPDLRLIAPGTASLDADSEPPLLSGTQPGTPCGVVELYDPLRVREITINDRSVPLESDIAAPMAYVLKGTDRRKLELGGFFQPESVQELAGLYMFEPYQKGKIPVVFVHGLLSGPVTWSEMFRELWAYPEIRENYQFWFFMYPTGTPFLASAGQFRRELDEIAATYGKDDPAMYKMVLVGHSMGGLVSKLQVTDSEDKLWSLLARQPPEALKTDDRTRAALTQTFFFDPEPMVRRVVFIGTPHQGSDLSKSPIGRIGSFLVQRPNALQKLQKQLVRDNPDAINAAFKGGVPSSIDMLASDSPVLQTMYQLPFEPSVKLHTIAGTNNDNVIGRGAVAEFLTGQRKKQPGDGVVPLESARLPGAETETDIPATHGKIHRHPLAFQEVARILKLHLHETQDEAPIQPVGNTRRDDGWGRTSVPVP